MSDRKTAIALGLFLLLSATLNDYHNRSGKDAFFTAVRMIGAFAAGHVLGRSNR